MSTLMQRGMEMAGRTNPAVAGGTIIYERTGDKVWIGATFGRSEFQTETAQGVVIEYNDRDFIFAAESLILSGLRITPQRGDRITVVAEEHGDGQVYEVLAPGNAQVYRTCDIGGHLFRVHTKRVAV